MKEKMFLNYVMLESEDIAQFKQYCKDHRRTIRSQLEIEILRVIRNRNALATEDTNEENQ
jgi:hypothetical protein